MKTSINSGDHSENGLRIDLVEIDMRDPTGDRITEIIVVDMNKDKVEKTTSIEGINHPKMTIMMNLVANLITKAVGNAITPEKSNNTTTKTLNVIDPQMAI